MHWRDLRSTGEVNAGTTITDLDKLVEELFLLARAELFRTTTQEMLGEEYVK